MNVHHGCRAVLVLSSRPDPNVDQVLVLHRIRILANTSRTTNTWWGALSRFYSASPNSQTSHAESCKPNCVVARKQDDPNPKPNLHRERCTPTLPENDAKWRYRHRVRKGLFPKLSGCFPGPSASFIKTVASSCGMAPPFLFLSSSHIWRSTRACYIVRVGWIMPVGRARERYHHGCFRDMVAHGSQPMMIVWKISQILHRTRKHMLLCLPRTSQRRSNKPFAHSQRCRRRAERERTRTRIWDLPSRGDGSYPFLVPPRKILQRI